MGKKIVIFIGFIWLSLFYVQISNAQQMLPFTWKKAGVSSGKECPANRRPQCREVFWVIEELQCWYDPIVDDYVCEWVPNIRMSGTFFDPKIGACRGPRIGWPYSVYGYNVPYNNCDACVRKRWWFPYTEWWVTIECTCLVNPVCPNGLRYNPTTGCCE